jgi:hypothetical protein
MVAKKIWRASVTIIGAELYDDFTSYDFDHELTEDEIYAVFDEFEKDHPLWAVNELQIKVDVIYAVDRHHLRNKK